MLRVFQCFCLFLSATTVLHAFEYDLLPAQRLNKQYGESVFHHLETGGRPSIAISGDTVAVVWEDNSSGDNAVYFSYKKLDAPAFTVPRRLSGKDYAYAPVITNDGKGFVIAWEQDETTYLTRVDTQGNRLDSVALGDDQERQIAFDFDGDKLIAAWVKGGFQYSDIITATIDIEDGLRVTARATVDPDSEKTLKAFPSILNVHGRQVVSWQDRRSGTNVIRYARTKKQGGYTEQKALSETVSKSAYYGKGSGVMRGSLARVKGDKIIALWLDKRASRSGYEVYASFSNDAGVTFGENHLVQDHFGDQYPQWNASIISNGHDRLLAIWNDSRDGEDLQDLYFSWYEDGVWSDDANIEISDELSDQTSPYAVIDRNGNIHVVWIDILDGKSSVNYTMLKVK